jgi:periplasmic protein TonB
MTALMLGRISERDPRELRRWALAAFIVFAVHAGAFGLCLWAWPQTAQIGGGTPIISLELAPLDNTADARQVDITPARQAMIEQKPIPPRHKEQPRKIESPPPVPPITTPDAELQQPEPAAKAQPQRPPAPVTAAPVRGGAPQVAATWETSLMRRLQQFKHYPAGALSRRRQGVALLGFTVDRNGRVLARRIVRSSGSADLDREALDMIERAQPLPPFPPAMTQAELSLTLPVRFLLR